MADRITVIGWDGTPLTEAAGAALAAATLVAGAPYQLNALPVPPGAERIALGSVQLAARRIAEHRGAAVVVAEGDPGFFGVVRTLRRPEYGLELEVLPAVSSVATAFARAGMPWEDAQVVSAHGGRLRRAANICRAHPKVAVLTAAGAGPSELALMLRGVHRTFVVCEGLGTSDEDVTVLTSDRVADRLWRDPNVVLVIGGNGPQAGAGEAAGWLAGRPVGFPGAERGWALPADAYAGAGRAGEGGSDPDALPAHVRALVLARLGAGPGDLVWAVGAGSGALAVEVARFGAAVVALEADSSACARIAVNARRFGVEVETVHGSGPQALGGLPEPDAAVVESGGAEAVRAVLARRPERIVAVARTFAEAEEIREAIAGAGYRAEGALLQSTPLQWMPSQSTPVRPDVARSGSFVPAPPRSAPTGPLLAREQAGTGAGLVLSAGAQTVLLWGEQGA
ncbi:precorrin-6y C5,15-methyltransferase (decarboxylating) subunit CbiE [Kitasatospora herbaricolor]|uniref:precorrin-6y C5,15-methyltransferase (decarboxylating) subunit CbiE n=1 Tax=Kitasatospora herbaricolor TaxID=68217 RepID=UPI00174DDB1D|nr:precorrin-6y C5,15-methyltransferase (decarboxylating) subunit CbiE [Kitasatospora herbaricolor]MDQ0312016.1 precorrin-6Y C5,15-methyltransferase (decarboxylating) [Kitasatospora herbaricolor]GGU97802.1 precorrin-6y C5,15-methyltransferase (decarboxylating) subunit CbiE [Kitasatospora herbaricolor]